MGKTQEEEETKREREGVRKQGEKIKKGKERECEEKQGVSSVCAVDHDAVLEESWKAAALHANQISQFKRALCPPAPVAPESQDPALLSPPRLQRANTDPHTHKHGQEATDTMVPINTSKPLFIPLLASRSVTFSLSVLVSAWLQSLCSALSRLLPSVLCSVFVYSHSREKSTSIYRTDDRVTGSFWRK